MIRFTAVASFAAVILAGCATPGTKTVCLPLTPYTPAQQTQAAAELGALPAGSVVGRMIADYGKMRDADRACVAAKP